jgi:hypothetical protein
MAEESRTIRVYLLDDHEVVRQGLRALLDSAGDIEVVGESGSAVDATSRIPASPYSTPGSPTGRGSRCAARCARWTRRSGH